MMIETKLFPQALSILRAAMLDQSTVVKTETWQGQDVRARPDAVTNELLNVTLCADLRRQEDLEAWRQEVKPNLPWADDHFLERVSGEPLNPPPSWAWWPWSGSASKHRDAAEKFNHTYPERYWPKLAGGGPHEGIRGQYGDLADVVNLLVQQPHSRQAYLPIFFPEDTGVGDGGRKPCTLGYQFIMRGGRLHVFYPMRSCDLMRHFADDFYLTVRLLLWMLVELRQRDATWNLVRPGTLTMHMTSLHVFANDMVQLKAERDAALLKALS